MSAKPNHPWWYSAVEFALAILIAFALMFALMIVLAPPSHAVEWSNDPKTQQWFRSLMQPDMTWMSCCGQADSYLADQFEVAKDGSYIAIITDDRDDVAPCGSLPSYEGEDDGCINGFRSRQHRAIGSRIYVPPSKVGCTSPNPTGHGLLFMPQIGTPKAVEDKGYDPVTQDLTGGALIPYCYCPPQMAKLNGDVHG